MIFSLMGGLEIHQLTTPMINLVDIILSLIQIKSRTNNWNHRSFSGSLSEVGIFTSGRNYRVNDTLVFEREQDGIENTVSKVSHVEGKEIDTITVSSTEIKYWVCQIIDW